MMGRFVTMLFDLPQTWAHRRRWHTVNTSAIWTNRILSRSFVVRSILPLR